MYILLVCCYIYCRKSDGKTLIPHLPNVENSVLHSLNYLILLLEMSVYLHYNYSFTSKLTVIFFKNGFCALELNHTLTHTQSIEKKKNRRTFILFLDSQANIFTHRNVQPLCSSHIGNRSHCEQFKSWSVVFQPSIDFSLLIKQEVTHWSVLRWRPILRIVSNTSTWNRSHTNCYIAIFLFPPFIFQFKFKTDIFHAAEGSLSVWLLMMAFRWGAHISQRNEHE